MLTSSRLARHKVFHNAPTVYPFTKPFHDTPYDQDRHPRDKRNIDCASERWPAWMDVGADGTGSGIGLHRAHPLSKLKGNLRRDPESVPRVLNMMMQGVWHKSGTKLYFQGGKPPNPSVHPYLTGEPCPVYGWRVTDPSVTREFDVPQSVSDKNRYKPYVALQERRLMYGGDDTSVAATGLRGRSGMASDSPAAPEPKPLMKRLFFWN